MKCLPEESSGSTGRLLCADWLEMPFFPPDLEACRKADHQAIMKEEAGYTQRVRVYAGRRKSCEILAGLGAVRSLSTHDLFLLSEIYAGSLDTTVDT